MRKRNDFLVVKEVEKIISLLEDKSFSMVDYINSRKNSSFVLFHKYLTHSDLPTFGKATKINSLEDNLLYYITTEEMEEIEKREQRKFETAHQSNIGMQKIFWQYLSMKDPRETVRNDLSEKIINNFANVFLVNDTLKYFSFNYTSKVFASLGKKIKNRSIKEWQKDKLELQLSKEEFTPIFLTQAVHGIGISSDKEFSKLRHHMFKNDQLFLLIERHATNINLFILPVKNPRFFTIIGETNKTWEKYQEILNRKIQIDISQSILIEEKEIITRKYQEKWRNRLAEEMMNFTTVDREVFCPLTYITGDFDEIGTLYRASHIKSFSESNDKEKYDLNNGLLLVANADALFDKHLITIGENKEIIFSFLIDNNPILKQKLLLNQIIFAPIFNEERMKYLKEHRRIFYLKEEKRKGI